MLHIFQYDNAKDRVTLNKPEILLIKEFKELMDDERNICDEDPKGSKHLLAYKEFTYIWLALDWQSFYSDYSEQERHQAALQDSQLTREQFNDPKFRAACRRYRDIQESIISSLDPQERDPQTGKPIWKVKDIQAELTNLPKVIDQLKQVEGYVKKEMQEQSQLRGGAVDGFTPKDF